MECCGRFINGGAYPTDAETLMRSRYSAYALGEIDYLPKTLPILDRKSFDHRGASEWSKQAKWTGLEIVSSKVNIPDKKSTVEFKANFKIADKDLTHHEICVFEKQMGRWFLIDGKIIEDKNT